jgi:hypothetical protein
LQRRVSAEVGLPVSEASIWVSLRQLERAHLLAAKLGTAGPMTRREMLGKAGRLGAAAAATPLIISALVPTAAAATTLGTCAPSGGNTFCGPGSPPSGTCACFSHFTSAGTLSAHKDCLVSTAAAGSGAACTNLVPCVAGSGVCSGGICTCNSDADCGTTGLCVNNAPNACYLKGTCQGVGSTPGCTCP